jgi:hypothetical protein
MASAAGKEIAKYRFELELIIGRIMADHSERCAAQGPMRMGASCVGVDPVEVEAVIERHHLGKAAA